MVKSHVECSSELVWQCVKKNNAYVRASVNRTRLSAEKGNVTAKHGFSSSGASFFVCIFFFIIIFSSVLSLLSFSLTSREKGRARCVVGRGRPPRVDLFFFFSLSLSLSIARACAQGHTSPLFHRTKQNSTPPKRKSQSARFWKKRQRKEREKREKKRERKKTREEKKKKTPRARFN